MLNSLSGKTALVSGAAGFLGAHVTRALIDAGAHVIGFVRPVTDLWRIAGVLEEIDLVLAPVPADFIFHLAAAGVQPGACDSDILENIALTSNLLNTAKPGTRFLHAGSCFEYGDGIRIPEDAPLQPRFLYGVTKAASTLLVNTYSDRLHVTTLRLFTIYGPGEPRHRLIPSTIEAALRNEAIAATSGDQIRDFVYVEDAANAFLKAASADIPSGETINIATGRSTRVRDVVEEVYSQAGASAQPNFDAILQRTGEYRQLSGDATKANEVLDWTATTSLESGIAQTLHSSTCNDALTH